MPPRQLVTSSSSHSTHAPCYYQNVAYIQQGLRNVTPVCQLTFFAVCTECGVEEICVRKNERGDCVSKEPKVKTCCEKGYEPRCKSEREEASDRREKEIEKLSEKLSEMEKKLVELTEQQKKAENNP